MIDKSILIVDDSDITRDMIAHSLKKDYLILQAENGLEALGVLAQRHIDLVLTDIMMPQLDGFGLIQRIKADEQLNKIPVVVVT
ncbi:MAG: response regulator, partial [Oscillospiraceae bacterium]